MSTSFNISPADAEQDNMINVDAECGLCGQAVTVDCFGNVTTLFRSDSQKTYLSLNVAGEVDHDCPNVTVPAP